MGVYEVLLPFILTFTIVFAILEKAKLFGKSPQTRNFNIVIGLVIAFFMVRSTSLVDIINLFLPRVSFVVLLFLMFLLILGIFGTGSDWGKGLPFFLALVGSFIGIFWAIYGSLPGTGGSSLPAWLTLDPMNKGYLLFGAIILLIVMMFREKKPDSGKWLKQAYEELSDPSKFGRK
ncbi:hypothetical protein D6777_04605 [Candidatus Woesearchaeota archaeon]|nr:MAG: hypothetical protein D6777_04605 [Candidatus Woesearchaeota archaeon]